MDGAFGPDERAGVIVVAGDEFVDMGHQFSHVAERSAPLRDLPAKIENQISIWFSQEACVGV